MVLLMFEYAANEKALQAHPSLWEPRVRDGTRHFTAVAADAQPSASGRIEETETQGRSTAIFVGWAAGTLEGRRTS
jgi:hypothetical protein